MLFISLLLYLTGGCSRTAERNTLIYQYGTIFQSSNLWPVVRDSIVGTVTRYGLDGPGIESQWGRDFPHSSTPVLGPPGPLYNRYRVWFPGVKRPDCRVDHPPPFNAEVKERVEQYFYSPSGPSWPVLRWNLNCIVSKCYIWNYIIFR